MSTRTRPMALRGISMDRRGFIQSFIGAAAMVVVPSKAMPKAVVTEESGMAGFGMAPIKMEGASIPDPGEFGFGFHPPLPDVPIHYTDHGIMTREDFIAQLREGLDTISGLHYREIERRGLIQPHKGTEDDDNENGHLLSGIPNTD